MLGLERLRWPQLDSVELTRPAAGPGRVRRVGDLSIHECGLPVAHRITRAGIRTTTAARTAIDLARDDDLLGAVVVLDSAMRRYGVDPADLAEVLHQCVGWPGSVLAAAALELTDAHAESVLESVSRAELTTRDLRPETQCWLLGADGTAVRADFLWWRERTVGEADGLAKYLEDGPPDRLSPLQAEKLRHARLEEWGLEVVRWGWREVRRDPDAVADRIRRGFARSAIRQEIRARAGEPEVVRRLPAAPWDLPMLA